MKVKHWAVAIICLVASLTTLAQETPAPLAMLQQTSQEMLNALNQNKASLKSDPNIVYRIVNKILLPRVDLETMGRSVVGREYWLQSTPAQHAEFKRLFTHQVTQTYSAALSSYQNEKVEFNPRIVYTGGERVQISSIIVRGNGQTIPVSYRLLNEGGSWKVYDFSVEGVSIVQSYSAQFSDDLQRGGLAQLLIKMQHRYGR